MRNRVYLLSLSLLCVVIALPTRVKVTFAEIRLNELNAANRSTPYRLLGSYRGLSEAAIERNLPRALTGSHGMSPAFEFLKMA
jgi:hypothetical protein